MAGEDSMADVLLTHSYHLFYDRKQVRKMQPYPPLGTLYAAALLQKHGHDVAVFDTMLLDPEEGFPKALDTVRPRLVMVYEDNFNFLSKMCLTRMRAVAFRMAQEARQAGAMVVAHGSDATDHCEEYLDAGFDLVLLGEAEWTAIEVAAEVLRGGRDFSRIDGVAFRSPDGALRFTPRRPLLKELDSLPLPARQLIDMELYRKAWREAHGVYSLNIVASRGCPFRCNWCAKPIYGNRYHAHSPERVVAEIKFLQEQVSFSHVWFADDIFGLKPGWVEAFAQALQAEGIHIRFKIQSRADLLVQERYVEALAAAGCEEVWMGAESGSQRILDAMDKGITIAQIEEATRLLQARGIRPCFFLQFGYPGETREDIELTLDLVRRLRPHAIGISVSYPLPGTKFYENVKRELTSKTNWVDSDELALLFQNTYPPAFYRQLHRFVHLDYRLQQARDLLRKPGSVSWTSLRKMAAGLCLTPLHYFTRQKLERLAR